MPLYEYKCLEHGKFEAIRGVGHSIDPCPQCGCLARRIPSPFRFKVSPRLDQADGEGFSSRYMSHAELKEQRRGNELGQT